MYGAQLPPAGAYLWHVFMRLHGRRGSTGFGAAPITWADLDAFVRLSGFRLSPWEIEVIEVLDSVFMTEQGKQATERMEKNKREHSSINGAGL